MSRRDTILVSVIANMVILTLLFVSALKQSPKVEVAKVPEPKKEALTISQESVDQVDQVLDSFAKEEPKVELLPEKNWVEVEVVSGDILDRIAGKYNTSVEEIVRANHLASTSLKVGQKLYIVPGEKKVEPKVVHEPKVATKTYTVKAGDSPWTIAIKNHMKVDELLALNGLNEAKAKKLKPGDKLIIR